MPAFTARTGMYLPGGGSLGIGGDDEVADIDRINQNMQKLDDSVGVRAYSSFPVSPFPGQAVSVGGDSYYFDDETGKWAQIAPHVGTTAPADPEEGWLWVDTN